MLQRQAVRRRPEGQRASARRPDCKTSAFLAASESQPPPSSTRSLNSVYSFFGTRPPTTIILYYHAHSNRFEHACNTIFAKCFESTFGQFPELIYPQDGCGRSLAPSSAAPIFASIIDILPVDDQELRIEDSATLSSQSKTSQNPHCLHLRS